MPLDYNNPEFYIGPYHSCYLGYSNDSLSRDGSASGGMVSSVLADLLSSGVIEGALVSRQNVVNSKIDCETFIATTAKDILDCRSSIYMHFPLTKSFKGLQNFKGKVAVVALPCQLRDLKKIEQKYPTLSKMIHLRIALFCGGAPQKELTEKVLLNNKIPLSKVKKIIYKKGHWRGPSHIKMDDGSERVFSYTFNFGAYKNLYFYSLNKCFNCQDHFGLHSDISFGDAWLKEMKDQPIKHNCIVARNSESANILNAMKQKSIITLKESSAKDIIKSQKRELVYKHHTSEAKSKISKFFNLNHTGPIRVKSKWNHYIAVFLIIINIGLSKNVRLNKIIFFLPKQLIFLYMGLIRVLLSF